MATVVEETASGLSVIQSFGAEELMAKRFIAREGYDPVYGARPLKRFLQQEIETPIARKIIAGELSDGSAVHVALAKDRLTIN